MAKWQVLCTLKVQILSMTVRDGPKTVDVLYLGSRRADLALLVACWIVVAHEEGALIDLAADVSYLHGAMVLFSKILGTLLDQGIT